MKSKNPFVVTIYTNPSGKIVSRVSGYLCGSVHSPKRLINLPLVRLMNPG
jgi:hypothetical protein